MFYRLIIVDDEYEIRSGLRQGIAWKSLGMEVVKTFADGRSALSFVSKNHIDVVLADIKMPNIGGLELAGSLREIAPNIKIVFLSAYRDFEYARAAVEYGVRGYLLKPTNPLELKAMMAAVRKELDAAAHSDESLATKRHSGSLAETIVAYVKKSTTDNVAGVTLKSVAYTLHLNPAYISTLFRKQEGVTFASFVQTARMNAAKQIMDYSDDSCAAIAERVGYSNPKNFSRAFRKHFGVSPRQYRQAPESSAPAGKNTTS